MKKTVFLISLAAIILAVLCAGCSASGNSENAQSDLSRMGGKSDSLMEKIARITEAHTPEQVHSLLGEPCDLLPTGIRTEVYEGDGYQAIIRYLSEGTTIDIFDENTEKTVTIL